MNANSLKPGTRITAPAGWICDCCSIVVADGYANMRCSEDTTHNVDGCCLLGQLASYCGPVHQAYNPSYSACFFSRNSIFSHKKSANSVFQPAYNSSRTAPTC
jgi:hypothetical protein